MRIASINAVILLAVALHCFAGEPHPPAVVIHVAVDGSDAWSGSLLTPNRARTDGPLATLRGARDRIRRLKQDGPLPDGGVTVEIHGGIYSLDETFELTGKDSGTQRAPVVYRGKPGGDVSLVGGREVVEFRPVDDPAIRQRLDERARDHVVQADLRALEISDYGEAKGGGLALYFNERPMTLARWPNEGFTRIVDLVGDRPVDVRGTRGDRIGKFVYDGDRPRRWTAENDAWLHGYWFWDWSDERQRVESIDTARQVISVVPPYHTYGYRKGQWFYAFNLLAEIDTPGEWYLDRTSGTLYFWPPAPPESGRATVSVLDTLVTLRDVSYVTLQGMTLEAARQTGVTIFAGTHNRVDGCTIRNLGGWAVQVRGGTNHGVTGCDVYQLGGGGVALSGGDRKTLTSGGHYVLDNHLYDYGRWNRMYSPAIALAGVGNRAAHNLIHNAPHQAVSFSGNDHLIELNEIHHVCLESNDAGAIYSGRDWTMRGTVIRHNFMHHVTGFEDRGCVGVYLDDMFSGTTITGNVFYQVTRAAFIGGGRDCPIENNVFVDCSPALHIDGRAMGWAGYHVATTMKDRLDAMPIGDPPWSLRYPQLPALWEDEPAAPKGNVVARNVSFGGKWDGVRAEARDFVTFMDNLVGEDPRFVDPAEMDFQLRDDSPVWTKIPGFQRIPFERIGPRDHPAP